MSIGGDAVQKPRHGILGRQTTLVLLFLRSLARVAGILGVLLLQAFLPLRQIEVTRDEVTLGLPDGLVFNLSAESASEITHASLHYGTNARTCQGGAARQQVEFEPGTAIEAEWEWKFRRSGVLPPGAELWWQWEIQDALGNSLLTERQTLVIQDQRQTWQRVERQEITIQWYSGSSAFAQELLAIAERSLDRLAGEMKLSPTQPVWITVYPTSEEIQEVLIRSTEWTGGVAFTEYGSILIAAAPGETGWAEEVIPHELAHILVRTATFNCRGGSLPTWLSEGLSVYAEGPISEFDRMMVTEALENGELPRLQTLEREFSAYTEAALLAYAQSAVLVDYLIEEYGAEKMSALLSGIQDGNSINESLTQVYDLDTQGIDSAWRISLGYQNLAPISTPLAQRATPTRVPTLALWTPIVRPSDTPPGPPGSTSTPAALPAVPSSTPAPASPTPLPTASPVSSLASSPLPWPWLIVVGFLAMTAGLIVGRIITKRR